MAFLETNEEEVIRKFMHYHNENSTPEDQVNLMFVKSIVYPYMTDNFETSFSGLTDTICREQIESRITDKLTEFKKKVSSCLNYRLSSGYYGDIYDTEIDPEFEDSEIEEGLVTYLQQKKSISNRPDNINFTNIPLGYDLNFMYWFLLELNGFC